MYPYNQFYNPYLNPCAPTVPGLNINQVLPQQQQAVPQQTPQGFDPQRQQLEQEFLKTEEGARLYNSLQDGFTHWRQQRDAPRKQVDYSAIMEEQKSLKEEINRLKNQLNSMHSKSNTNNNKPASNAQVPNRVE